MVGRLLRFISLGLVAAMIGVMIFSISLDVPFDRLEADYGGEAPAYLDLASGARAHYRDQGNPHGPPLILLHGSNSSLHTWAAWVRILGDRYRLISVDLPGHGLTGRTPGDNYSRFAMVEFVVQVADALEIEQFAVAGNSMGGGVAWALARRHGDRVSHLVLVAPSGIGRVPQDPPLAFKIAENPLTRPLLRWLAPRWLFANGLYASFTDDNFVSDDRIDRYWRLNRLAGNRIATMARFALPQAPDLNEFDAAIEVPTLILWGEDDQVLPFDRERVMWDLRTKFAGGPRENPLVSFAATGHLPHVERAQATAAVLSNFLETHSP